MKTVKRLFVSLLFSSLLLACSAVRTNEATQSDANERYSAKVQDKALQGMTNMMTGFLEVPKNMINATNAEGSNIVFGVFGGALKGTIDAVGRTTAGIAEFLTAPLLTKPIVEPRQIWDDFDRDTLYGKAFRLEQK